MELFPYSCIGIRSHLVQLLPSLGATQLFMFYFCFVPLLFPLVFTWRIAAPQFALKTSIAYSLSCLVFLTFYLYIDQGVHKLNFGGSVLSAGLILAFFIILPTFMTTLFTSFLTPRRGYRTILDGSVLVFEVRAEIDDLFEELKNVPKDFNLFLERNDSKKHTIYMTTGKGRTVMQFILLPSEDPSKARLAITLHSIRKDVPMKGDFGRLRTIGLTLLEWLRVKKGWTSSQYNDTILNNTVLDISANSFKRQPVRLPSRVAVSSFFENHWKDFVIAISLMIAVLAWLFPR